VKETYIHPNTRLVNKIERLVSGINDVMNKKNLSFERFHRTT
jgi:hypothetical protein